jgi:phosphopantothenoylcysteine decarboxylase/phosphopantothenate--cysteine ligase
MVMRPLSDKSILLGVCGGIAAYKAVELLRLLTERGARVRVITTINALNFVGVTTFEALSKRPVCSHLFGRNTNAEAIGHIDWAQNADGIVIAPATANVIGKMAGGIADDALTTILLATSAPVLLCPAMNSQMYQHRAVQRNLHTLREDGIFILPPEAGELACGTVGPGRLPDPGQIAEKLAICMAEKDFSDRSVLVTAGPTWEMIDPVRFVSNPSSGKMGFAIARAAVQRGARVTLVSGPSHLADPVDVELVRVRSAQQMAEAVLSRFEKSDIVIKAAAVSDYRPAESEPHKRKKNTETLSLSLVRTLDILKTIGKRKDRQILVGFAAETQALKANATAKLKEKRLDLIVANDVGTSSAGFASDNNTVTLFFKGGRKESLPSMPKDNLAHLLLDRIAALLPEIP